MTSAATTTTSAEPYTAIAERKQTQRANLIPKEWRIPSATLEEYLQPKGTNNNVNVNVIDVPLKCGIPSPRELHITGDFDAVDLLDMLSKGPQEGGFSVEEVITAFCKRAAVAQQVTNCLTEIFFEDAIQRAKELDSTRAQNSTAPLPPLWGLPISLKDSFKIPGFDATIGLVHFAEKPCNSAAEGEDDELSALPRLLRDLGAVFYCKTNVPQTLMTADSDNNVFGRTWNPHNKALSAGGSSGGEGALIAMRGSVVGIGTDIAGSIRIPSLCCGIYGFKPSAHVVPYAGQQIPGAPGLPGLVSVAGPMATSMRSCELILREVMSHQPWKYDVDCLHIPWNSRQLGPLAVAEREGRKLRIGILEDEGMFTPTPPMRRALAQAKAKLQRGGIETVDIRLPNVARDMGVLWGMASLEGSKTVLSYIASAGEPLVESVRRLGLVGLPSKSLEDLCALNVGRHRAQTAYRDLWVDNKLDAIVNLLAPHTAPPLDTWAAAGQALWNLVDYPSCIIPTGEVEEGDVVDKAAKYGPADEKMYALYTGPDDYKGAPTAIQLIGMRQEDQNLALLACVVDGILNGQ